MPLIITKGYGLAAGGGGGPFVFNGITTAIKEVHLNFSVPPFIGGPALDRSLWSIVGPNDSIIVVDGVIVVGNSVILNTSEMAQGVSYTLNMPTYFISNGSGVVFPGPFTQIFTGTGTNPFIVITQTIDTRTVLVHFNETINELDGRNENNYSANNGLSIISAEKVSNTIYKLHTSLQTVGTSYTITASNIRDAQGNLT